eukprot:1329310-Amorphochlora_amoeboformis.AAC.1
MPSNSPSTACPSQIPTTNSPITSAPTYSAPMPIKAQFTDDYSSIVLSFDKESNTPAHGCHVFTNSTSKTFGSGARCTWTDPTTLTVFLGVGFTISPNDTVTIEKDNFREK